MGRCARTRANGCAPFGEPADTIQIVPLPASRILVNK
jgi:hypothetical protein